jgi:hypothetical protein
VPTAASPSSAEPTRFPSEGTQLGDARPNVTGWSSLTIPIGQMTATSTLRLRNHRRLLSTSPENEEMLLLRILVNGWG